MQSRRSAPSILFTALAATVVIVPWAISGTDAGEHPTTADAAPKLTQQPLDNLAVGESIREIHQDTPFSMVALTSPDLRGTSARVRARKDDGSWGPWYQAENLDGVGADTPGPRGTEPVFVGRTNTVQIAVTRAPQAPAPAPGKAGKPGAAKPALGYVPANVEAPIGQNVTAVLISPPQAPVDVGPLPTAAINPGQPPAIISRAQWGADESMRCGNTVYDKGIRAGIVHHTAGSNDYAPEDSAGIVRSIYEYHTRELGWCDIAYNAMVDKYGQVFEGRAGGMDKPVEGSHTGGFNIDTWGVAMMGDFDVVPPTEIQVRNTGRLLGWRLGLSHVDPHGTVQLTSAGGSFTHFPRGATPTLPTIFTHRDVGITDCPGNAAYAQMDHIRDIAARFNQPPGPADLADQMRGGAIYNRWQAEGGPNGMLGNPTSPETAGEGTARYATFERGAVYWSPESGAEPVTGAIYEAWGTLGFERGVLGLPTSAEIPEPQWIVQNFQHGTLNFDREKGTVTRVVDGVPVELPPPSPDQQPVQLERFTPIT
ncbi:cold shock protein [Mycolicibacterium conceptionense]|uniref:Cold shock protein n=2 Tax=Mycolicibacterium TaxID=1866885 RepID=A0ABR5FYM6_9MYCO|nr:MULTISPECIES: N-acetylmuramoyl-L-alanine amidase [Mycolicibacterium]KLI04742.1 cold shock protein [Mycolicibacterium senegalense]KLO53026.1 cold shock protein [Mycolicibacterium senegalense]KMV14585.1 cold shock protein [Mycolicibacterium conceptionense]OBK07142.1 cold-shock protein [Mycolicibacterium conceptionense]